MITKSLENLLTKNVRLYITCTGAGAGIQKLLWDIPGISSVLVGASFPYESEETDEFLGFNTDVSYCSKEMAVDLAMQSYYKAFKYGASPAVGIGLTASVASTRMHRGDHRVFVSAFTDDRCILWSVRLKKGVGLEQRIKDGNFCDLVAAQAIASVTDCPLIRFGDYAGCFAQYDQEFIPYLAEQRFFKRPFFSSDGTRLEKLPIKKYSLRGALFPGAFNPPHAGHLGMVEAYVNYFGGPVAFAIESKSPHKGDLTVSNMLQRAKTLHHQDRLFTSGLPLYVDKANAYPGLGIILGVDSLIRLQDPKWGVNKDDLILNFLKLRTQFYVTDRVIDGKLVRLNDISTELRCKRLTGRWDVSSSEVRNPHEQVEKA